ncbi:MAG: hypothetical protein GX786_09110 [Clostridiales bacterium]|nr:hypothetical protein [Clostridiales bacterium]
MKKHLSMRFFSFFLVFLFLPFSVVCGENRNITLFPSAAQQQLFGKEATLLDIAYENETIYMLFQSGIYRYTLDNEEPLLLSSFFPIEQEGEFSFSTYEEAFEQIGEDAKFLFRHLFTYQERLYGYNPLTGDAVPFDLETGSLLTEEMLHLAYIPPLQDEEGGTYSLSIQGVIGSKLLLLLTAHYPIEYPKSRLLTIDISTTEQTFYDVANIKRAMPYQGETLLLLTHDEQADAYDSMKFELLDLSTGSLSPYGELNAWNAQGFTYSPKEDAVFYSAENTIYKWRYDTQGEKVGYIQVSTLGKEGEKAWITSDLRLFMPPKIIKVF